MKTIYKYQLEITDLQCLKLPQNAKILTAQIDSNGFIQLWAIVYPYNPKQDVCIRIFGTGNPVTNDIDLMKYIATVQDKAFVWHIFKEK